MMSDAKVLAEYATNGVTEVGVLGHPEPFRSRVPTGGQTSRCTTVFHNDPERLDLVDERDRASSRERRACGSPFDSIP
jgi:hypothetical protein